MYYFFISKISHRIAHNDEDQEIYKFTANDDDKRAVLLNITSLAVFVNSTPFRYSKRVTKEEMDNILNTFLKWTNDKKKISSDEFYEIV